MFIENQLSVLYGEGNEFMKGSISFCLPIHYSETSVSYFITCQTDRLEIV